VSEVDDNAAGEYPRREFGSEVKGSEYRVNYREGIHFTWRHLRYFLYDAFILLNLLFPPPKIYRKRIISIFLNFERSNQTRREINSARFKMGLFVCVGIGEATS